MKVVVVVIAVVMNKVLVPRYAIISPIFIMHRLCLCDSRKKENNDELEITNWSSTHSCHPRQIYYPTSTEEVHKILKEHHDKKEKIRVIGTGLSPNGIGMCDEGGSLLSVAHIDHISVDLASATVTAGAGATVRAVLKELNKYGLTLENFSSIQEQQLGGWTQVAAHGTGCGTSTAEDMVMGMQLVSPTFGVIELTPSSEPHLTSSSSSSATSSQSVSVHHTNPLSGLLPFARVGLGALGVVTQLTLKCVPEVLLRETTTVLHRGSADLAAASHLQRLRKNRHVRYMWLPYTDAVVSVVSNPTSDSSTSRDSHQKVSDESIVSLPTRALCDLLLSLQPDCGPQEARALSFAQLRDRLLDHSPLSTPHVMRVNRAEAQYWAGVTGERVDRSVNILGFDCGGEQWVYEVCIPMGKLSGELHRLLDDNTTAVTTLEQSAAPVSRDVEFVYKLLELVETFDVPAPCPIEQRWTCGSLAPMSPAYSPAAGGDEENEVFTWVGVIMYLPPSQTPEQRAQIAAAFKDYCRLADPLVQAFGGTAHWAKLELPRLRDGSVDQPAAAELRDRLRRRFPVDTFNRYRALLDSNNILSNELIDTALGQPIPQQGR